MRKKQHNKDQMFITKTEWATEWGGAKSKESAHFKRLPFYCCSLTFTPFGDPMCTSDGSIFDLMNIMPYIRMYGKHPVIGGPLRPEDLISLIFHKNKDGTMSPFEYGETFVLDDGGEIYHVDSKLGPFTLATLVDMWSTDMRMDNAEEDINGDDASSVISFIS